jgi:hypothetical protein
MTTNSEQVVDLSRSTNDSTRFIANFANEIGFISEE